MAQGVVADNWSLQDISTLLTDGLEQDESGEIVVENGTHSYKKIASAIIQTEALFDFLTDLLLRDEILVEEKFTYAWETINSPLLEARKIGVVRAHPFLGDTKNIAGPRDRIVEHLCSTQSLKDAHEKNVVGWKENRTTPDGLLSATLWGGAGMCARSYVFERSYTPHPLRKRLFLNSGFMLPAGDALHQLVTFIADHKVKVTRKIFGSESLYSTYVNIPAIPLRIIQESSSADQLIKTALQMREDFRSLREWLKMFQNAISSDDTPKLIAYRKQLDSVSEHVNKKVGFGSSSKPVTMEAGYGMFKIVLQGNPIEQIKNQFGVRANLNELIFGSNGKSELAKYVKMFGEQGTSVGYELQHHFTARA